MSAKQRRMIALLDLLARVLLIQTRALFTFVSPKPWCWLLHSLLLTRPLPKEFLPASDAPDCTEHRFSLRYRIWFVLAECRDTPCCPVSPACLGASEWQPIERWTYDSCTICFLPPLSHTDHLKNTSKQTKTPRVKGILTFKDFSGCKTLAAIYRIAQLALKGATETKAIQMS